MRKRGFSFRSPRSRHSELYAECAELPVMARGGFDNEQDLLASAMNDIDDQSEALSMEHATSEVQNQS